MKTMLKYLLIKQAQCSLHIKYSTIFLILPDMQGCTNRTESDAELSKAFSGMEGHILSAR